MDGQRVGVLEDGVPAEERTGRTGRKAAVSWAGLVSVSQGDGDEEPIGGTLTHFARGRSPPNPFPEARPRRKVPGNLQSQTTGRVVHHAFSSCREDPPADLQTSRRESSSSQCYSHTSATPKTQIKKLFI